jgi:hypothetical protein
MRTAQSLPGLFLVSVFVALSAACESTPPAASPAEGPDPCKINESVDMARMHGCVGDRSPTVAVVPAATAPQKPPLSEKEMLKAEKPMNAPPVASPPPPRPEVQPEKVQPPPPQRAVIPPPHTVEPPIKPPPK